MAARETIKGKLECGLNPAELGAHRYWRELFHGQTRFVRVQMPRKGILLPVNGSGVSFATLFNWIVQYNATENPTRLDGCSSNRCG